MKVQETMNEPFVRGGGGSTFTESIRFQPVSVQG
jgi:hypothetical protein